MQYIYIYNITLLGENLGDCRMERGLPICFLHTEAVGMGGQNFHQVRMLRQDREG